MSVFKLKEIVHLKKNTQMLLSCPCVSQNFTKVGEPWYYILSPKNINGNNLFCSLHTYCVVYYMYLVA